MFLTATIFFVAVHAFSLSLTIRYPTNGTVIASGGYSIEVSEGGVSGALRYVEFFVNGIMVGRATNEPFLVTINNPVPGHYRLTAHAFDTGSFQAEAPPVYLRVGNPTLRVARGPYLQSASSTNMILRWRTDWFADAVVRYATNASSLDGGLTNSNATIDHEMNLTGLQADTLYFYSIGTATNTFVSGSNFSFRTAPTNARPVRIWVVGDSGTADTNAASVRDSYYTVTGAQATDLFLMLGDNAYESGTDGEYQRAMFDMYRDLLQRTPVWPTIGNHEAGDALGVYGTQAKPYLEMFTLPRNGECGGLASGTEHYYSFDFANIHFVCLDSYLSDRANSAPMCSWLRNDLANTDKDWIIAYWHHPPYSFSGHHSDQEFFGIEMRQFAGPILEEYGVDLVLSGHNHDYERSFLIDGHYGFSWELQSSMVLNAGFGRPGDDGAYRKPAGGMGAHGGTIYTICGCSGQGGSGDTDIPRHPVMALTRGGFGSMIIEINGLRLDAQFLRPSMAVDDYFTIDKSLPTTNQPPMHIVRSTNGAVISWPTSQPAFELESAAAIPATNWQSISEPVSTIGRRNVVAIEMIGPKRFFQLRSP